MSDVLAAGAIVLAAVAFAVLMAISAVTSSERPRRPAPAHRPRHARKRSWAPVKGVTCLRVRLVPAVTRYLARPQAEQARQQQSGQAS